MRAVRRILAGLFVFGLVSGVVIAVPAASTTLGAGIWWTTPVYIGESGGTVTFGPFTYSSTTWTRLRIVLSCPGEQVAVYDGATKIAESPAPSAGGCDYADGETLWANPGLNKVDVALPPGAHAIDFELLASATGGATVTLRWDPTDPPPGPSTADDCKNGGWRDFGFRNQGQCVSAMASGR
jgi:hypothetical protein